MIKKIACGGKINKENSVFSFFNFINQRTQSALAVQGLDQKMDPDQLQ